MLKKIQVLLYPPKQPHWHGYIKKHVGVKTHVPLLSSLLTLKRFHTFLSISMLNFAKCCRLHIPAELKYRKVNIMK